MVHNTELYKLSQKEAEYELDATWVLRLCKTKSPRQAIFKNKGLGKKYTKI